jgi:hypothetical protein
MTWLVLSLTVTLVYRGRMVDYTNETEMSLQLRFSGSLLSFRGLNLTVVLLIVMDVSIVLLANGLYVALEISGAYAFSILLFVAVLLSMCSRYYGTLHFGESANTFEPSQTQR